MLPYDCNMCEDTGRYRDYGRGNGGRIVLCDHTKYN